MWIKCNCLICSVLCIKAATGATGQEMEAAVVTGSSGDTLTGVANTSPEIVPSLVIISDPSLSSKEQALLDMTHVCLPVKMSMSQ